MSVLSLKEFLTGGVKRIGDDSRQIIDVQAAPTTAISDHESSPSNVHYSYLPTYRATTITSATQEILPDGFIASAQEMSVFQKQISNYLADARKIPKNVLKNIVNVQIFSGIANHAFLYLTSEKTINRVIKSFEGNIYADTLLFTRPSPKFDAIAWLARKLDCEWHLAARVMAKYLSIEPENCFARFPIGKGGSFPAHAADDSKEPPAILIADNVAFRLHAYYRIRSVAGNNLQTVCDYTDVQHSITI